MFFATTTVALHSGTTTDAYDDLADDNSTASATGVRASIMEVKRTVFEPDTGRLSVIRVLSGRFPAGTPISVGDRVQDEKTGTFYIIESIDRVASPVNTPDLRSDLSLVE
jgi:translation elongation factor EF-G